MSEQKICCLEYRVGVEDYEVFCGLLFDCVSWGWEEEDEEKDILFRISLSDAGLAEEIKRRIAVLWPDALSGEYVLPDRDWAESWKAFFTPVEIDNDFLVLPSWEMSGVKEPHLSAGQDSSGVCRIFIEPKMAFGTGHHPTTALCLGLLAELRQKGLLARDASFLDVGTGSGILAIACAQLGLSGLALDIDPVAVFNCRENLILNRVQDQVALLCSTLQSVQGRTRFSLALANILAGPLQEMAPLFKDRISPGGMLILSGILNEQVKDVVQAYVTQGFAEVFSKQDGEWTGLLMVNGR